MGRLKLKTPLVLALIGIILPVLTFFSVPVNIFFHSLINIYAGGRSSVKVFLFFGYLLFLCVLGLLATLTRFNSIIKKFKISTKWLLTSLGASFLYGILLLWWFYQKLGFRLSDFVIAFNNNEISSTMLFHNHLPKGFNGLLLKTFGQTFQENMDAGWAFAGLIPEAFFWVGGLLIFISAVLLILKFLEIYSGLSKQKALFIILYSVISFSLIKNLLDGGLFNRETPVALSALLFLILTSAHKTKSIKLQALTRLSLIPILGYLIIILSTPYLLPALVNDFWFNLYMTATFGIGMLSLVHWWHNQKITRLGILLLILTGTMAYVPIAQGIGGYMNSLQTIPEDGAYVGLYEKPAENIRINYQKIESINNLSVFKVTTVMPVTVQDIMQDNNLLNNLGPITVPWVSCMPAAPQKTISFDLVTTKPLQKDNNKYEFGYIQNAKLIDENDHFKRYEIKARIHRCAPRILNVLEELIKARGQETFFILNLSENSDNVL